MSADRQRLKSAIRRIALTPEEMPEGYSRTAAEEAFASINQPGGLLMAVDVDPHQQFAEWGLVRIIREDI